MNEKQIIDKLVQIQGTGVGGRRLVPMWRNIPPQLRPRVWREIRDKLEVLEKYEIADTYTPIADIIDDAQRGIIINANDDNQSFNRTSKSRSNDEVVAEGSESG